LSNKQIQNIRLVNDCRAQGYLFITASVYW